MEPLFKPEQIMQEIDDIEKLIAKLQASRDRLYEILTLSNPRVPISSEDISRKYCVLCNEARATCKCEC